MDDSQVIRRSERKRIRPVEFWNFEKPENVTCEVIIYNEPELTKHSIKHCVYKTFCSSTYNGDVTENASRPDGKFNSISTTAAKKNRSLAVSKSSTGVKNAPSALSKTTTQKTSTSALSKTTSAISKTKTAKKTKNSSALSTKNSVPKQSKGRKRSHEEVENAETHPAVNGTDGSPPKSPKLRRGKENTDHKSPGKTKTQSPHKKSSVRSPRVSVKKQKLGEQVDEEEKDEGYSAHHTASVCSPKFARRRPGRGVVGEENTETRRGEETYNRQEDVSVVPPKNNSQSCGSFFNDSDRRQTRSAKRGKNTTQNTTENTTLEPPSFHNILSSTAIEAPGRTVFKVPRMPSFRKPPGSFMKISQCVEPSMVTIPEEEDEEEEQKEKEQEQEEDHQGKTRVDGEKPKKVDATTTASTDTHRKRARSEKDPSASVTLQPEGHTLSQAHQDNVTQDTSNIRRSSRVRTKRLEFWNFEKLEVERKEDGELKVIHQKQDSTMHIKTRIIDCSSITAIASQTNQGITLTDDFLRTEEPTVAAKPRVSPRKFPKHRSKVTIHPALSPSQGTGKENGRQLITSWSPNRSLSSPPIKRKLFSPNQNFYDEPVEEESRVEKFRVGDQIMTMVGRVKFSDLQFVVLEKKDYRCYVAHGMKDEGTNTFISYLFLERGNIIWNNSGKLTMYVIEGYGYAKIVSDKEGELYTLKAKSVFKCPKDSKLSLKKDGRCKMLKLHLCLVRSEPKKSKS